MQILGKGLHHWIKGSRVKRCSSSFLLLLCFLETLYTHLVSMQLPFVDVCLLLTPINMHGLPCSSLGHCFGNPSDGNPDPAPPFPSQEARNLRRSRNVHNKRPDSGAVISQPKAQSISAQEHEQPHKTTVSVVSTSSTKAKKGNGITINSVCKPQYQDNGLGWESPMPCSDLSQTSECEELEEENSPELELKYTHIPRPSITIVQPQVQYLLLPIYFGLSVIWFCTL